MSIRSNVDRAALNERVTLRRRAVMQDEVTGAVSELWATLGVVWAKVDGAKASRGEPTMADARQTFSDYTVWVRADVVKRFSLVPADQVVWRDRVFDIKDIPDQQLRGRLAALNCRVNGIPAVSEEVTVIIDGGGDDE